jgi:hypothetical protein
MARTCVFLLSCAIALVPSLARAQTYETIGIRAQGMAGAFVAVADDATASWWNPAGLAKGALFSALIEYDGNDAQRARGIAIGLPSLALSYYRLYVSEMQSASSTEGGPPGRKEQRVLHQFGATVGQSLGNHLVLGSTFKLLRADQTRADLDFGMLATFGTARIGLTVKNLRTPTLGEGDRRLEFHRKVRAGAAWMTGAQGRPALTAAVDADLTTTRTDLGDARHVAAGAEVWTPGRQLGARGGASYNTVGDARTAVSGGLSASIAQGTFIDVEMTRGADLIRRGWGLSLRLTF